MPSCSGSYIFPADVLVSANFHHHSGDAFARQVRFEGGETIPSIVLNVEPIGTQRLPNINLLTFRVEKSFRLRAAQQAGDPTQSVQCAEREHGDSECNTRSGAEFLRPRDIMPPRLAELSASYTF